MSMPQDRWAWLPLGQMLVNEKVLTADQLNRALDRQRKTRERLGQILIDMKLIDEDILLKYLGAQFRKEPITRQDLAALDPDVVKLVPEEVARQYGVIAAQRSGRKLIVATADPLNVMALDDLRRATGLDVDFRIGPAGAIQDAIDKTYRKVTTAQAAGLVVIVAVTAINVRGLRKEGSHWESDALGKSKVKIRVEVHGGIGSVNLIAD